MTFEEMFELLAGEYDIELSKMSNGWAVSVADVIVADRTLAGAVQSALIQLRLI